MGARPSPVQLAIGWSIVSLSALGLLHVLFGPDKISDGADEVVDAGGYIGALVGAPLEALLAPAGAAVVLTAVLLGGALIITRTSIRTFAQNTGGFLAAVGAPLGRAAKSGISNISTLSSDREGAATGDGPMAAPYDVAGEASDTRRPGVRPVRLRCRGRRAGERRRGAEAASHAQAHGLDGEPAGAGEP